MSGGRGRDRRARVGTDARARGDARASETKVRERDELGERGVERGRGGEDAVGGDAIVRTKTVGVGALSRDAIGECAKGTLRDSWLWEKLSDVTKRVSEGERAATLLDYLPDDEDRVAVDCVDGTRRGMTHKELRILIDRVSEKDMPEWGVRSHGRRVAVLVPNGPELMDDADVRHAAPLRGAHQPGDDSRGDRGRTHQYECPGVIVSTRWR